MALITIAASPLTNTSAWCHDSKVRTGGWLIPRCRSSHSASLSINQLLLNRRQPVAELTVELKNVVTQPSPRHHLSKGGFVLLLGRSWEQQAILSWVRTGNPLELNP